MTSFRPIFPQFLLLHYIKCSKVEDALVKLVKTVETVETGFRWQKISVPKKFWPEYFCPNYHPMHLSSKTFLKEKVFRTNIGIVCCNIGYQRLTNSHTAWLPRRGMKEEVKMPEGSQARSRPQRSPDTTCQSIPTQIWGIYISNWLRFEAYTFYMEQLDLPLNLPLDLPLDFPMDLAIDLPLDLKHIHFMWSS